MIQLSKAAVREINRLKLKQPDPDIRLRLAIQPGGCEEYHYVLKFDEAMHSGDRLIDCASIQVVVDPESWEYLSGLSLDYSEDLMGGGFRFHNPNAEKTCGCGNSFSTSAPSQIED